MVIVTNCITKFNYIFFHYRSYLMQYEKFQEIPLSTQRMPIMVKSVKNMQYNCQIFKICNNINFFKGKLQSQGTTTSLQSLKNKSCTLDLEEKELLVLPNHTLIFLPQIIGLLVLFIVEMQPKTKKAYDNKKINNK